MTRALLKSWSVVHLIYKGAIWDAADLVCSLSLSPLSFSPDRRGVEQQHDSSRTELVQGCSRADSGEDRQRLDQRLWDEETNRGMQETSGWDGQADRRKPSTQG